MARRSDTSTATEAPAAAETTTEAPEEASMTSTVEAPEATDSTTTEPTAPATEATDSTEPTTDAEWDALLEPFTQAVTTAVEARDSSTGEIPVASVDPVKAAYRALDGIKAKNRAKAVLQAGVKDGMAQLNIQLARAYMQLADEVPAATSAPKAEKAPVDPTQAFVDRVAAINLASALVQSSVPEGVEDGWGQKVTDLVSSEQASATAYLAWFNSTAEDKGDEPEASNVVKAAVKISQGKAGRVAKSSGGGTSTYEGPRRSIATHIENAFAGVESGTFLTIAQIRAVKSDEYGDDLPSQGAISARLFPPSGKCTVEGITPGTNSEGNKGATKD